jgi:hypothetical protein
MWKKLLKWVGKALVNAAKDEIVKIAKEKPKKA